MLNWWNWRPLVALLVRSGVLPAGEREERCSFNGCGGHLSSAEALLAADQVGKVIARMKQGERLLLDGTVTSKPKDYTLPISEWDETETQNRYSVDLEVLVSFAGFCSRSRGFEVL